MIINCKINLDKVPKERIYQGEKGKYLNVNVAERREPDQFGNTHTVYLYDKDAEVKKVYIGDGKVFEFGNQEDKKEMQRVEELPTLKEEEFDDLPF